MRIFEWKDVVNPLNGVVIIINCEAKLVKEVGSQNDVISTVLVNDICNVRINRDVATEFWKTNVIEHERLEDVVLLPKAKV